MRDTQFEEPTATTAEQASPGERTLGPRFRTFLQTLIDTRPERRSALGVAGYLAKQHKIGRRSQTTDAFEIEYSSDDFVRAFELLTTGVVHTGLGRQPSGLAHQPLALAAPAGVVAEPLSFPQGRHRTEFRSSLIATSMIGMAEGVVTTERHFVSIDWREALQLPFEAIVLCQRLDDLALVRHYPWVLHQLAGRRAIAVYVGDGGLYRAQLCAEFVHASKAPVLCLFDFDPRAIVRAAGFPRVEALCFPPSFDACGSPRLNQSYRALVSYHTTAIQSALLSSPHRDVLRRAWGRMVATRRVFSTLDYPACT